MSFDTVVSNGKEIATKQNKNQKIQFKGIMLLDWHSFVCSSGFIIKLAEDSILHYQLVLVLAKKKKKHYIKVNCVRLYEMFSMLCEFV